MCTAELWKKWVEEKWTKYGDEIDYIMGAWEKGALTGVLHLQGWIQFSIRKKLVRQKKDKCGLRKGQMWFEKGTNVV